MVFKSEDELTQEISERVLKRAENEMKVRGGAFLSSKRFIAESIARELAHLTVRLERVEAEIDKQ